MSDKDSSSDEDPGFTNVMDLPTWQGVYVKNNPKPSQAPADDAAVPTDSKVDSSSSAQPSAAASDAQPSEHKDADAEQAAAKKAKISKWPPTALANKVVLYQGDITRLEVDAVVNAANSGLWAGGGICGAIHRAAGPQLAMACREIGGCPTGDTAVTPAFRLPSKFVFHSVGPMGEDPEALASCYRTCMEQCVKTKARSIALCCISTGIFGYPNRRAAGVALRTTRRWLETDDNASKIDRIIFCTFLNKDLAIYTDLMAKYYQPEPAAWDAQAVAAPSSSAAASAPSSSSGDKAQAATATSSSQDDVTMTSADAAPSASASNTPSTQDDKPQQ